MYNHDRKAYILDTQNKSFYVMAIRELLCAISPKSAI